ncbi:thymus-specific serine protease-like [Tenrec ecaudatus]|uniref:thymus-specific serine protease-like n=1 Tax=Tenrec ecaudatus TaxID=94439 RepID=UPI003F5A572E
MLDASTPGSDVPPPALFTGHPAALAPALGALVVGLEHRFYGLSVPAGGLDMGQLRFLSSRQALADMASAHLTLSRLFNVSSSGPWICFIGSYAGSLATWARLKVPRTPVGGPGEGNPHLGVAVSMSVSQIVLHSLEQKCLSTSRAETVAQLRDTDPQVSSMGDRQWLYPTCTEFGFYITCAGPACPFSQLPTLPSQLSLCEQVFGLSISSVSQAVEQTNCYYGGQSPRATHVLFVNGDSDPWHVLSVTQSLGPLESALLIPNASHCLDMAPERASDAPSLRLARQKIFQQLQTWLLQAKESQVKGVSERQALAPSYVATWIMDTSHSTEGSGLL